MKNVEAERFWREQLLLAMRDCESDMAARGLVPDRNRSSLRRFRSLWIYVAGLLLALSLSYFAVLANFLVLNRFLHIVVG